MIVHAAVYRFPLERLVPYSLLQLHAGYLLREIHLAAVAALYHLGELLGYAALRAVVLRKKHILVVVFVAAVIVGILAGVLSSLGSVLGLAALFGFSHEEYITFLPKSITTAIGMGVSEELGGIVSITAGVIIITGVLGNILAEVVLKVFRITEPVAKGIALGTSAHAIGTAKAMELGEAEGAMSSLSIAVSGIITVAGAALFANLY